MRPLRLTYGWDLFSQNIEPDAKFKSGAVFAFANRRVMGKLARRLLRHIELHYTPQHASWIKMFEIEIGVLANQCLDRRIESFQLLIAEVAAWEKKRNSARARVNWSFTTERARAKMGEHIHGQQI